MYCGVCHTDIHQAHNDWGFSEYPLCPGHEIVGKVTEVGKDCTKFKVGDIAAVGCMVDSCRKCPSCRRGEEQYCSKGMVWTCSNKEVGRDAYTMGGYSKHLVVDEDYAVLVPASMELSSVAPLLCAGITSYSPLRHFNVGPGSRIAITGLGGVGHMCVKLAAAMGAHVTVVSRTDGRKETSAALGAEGYIVSSDAEAMKAAELSFDLFIDFIPVEHSIDAYVPLLKADGSLVIIGQIGEMPKYQSGPLITSRRSITGSLIGSIQESQELVDFCYRKGIKPNVQTVDITKINEVWESMHNAVTDKRYVIDMSTLKC